MSNPSGDDVRNFARMFYREQVISLSARASINIREAFVEFLIDRGAVKYLADEFAERNISAVMSQIQKRSDEWDALDLKSPAHILEEGPQLITWAHPLFEHLSGRQPISADFCSVLETLRNCKPREFLGYAACYLCVIGCDRIFITDTSGDAGVDLIGVFSRGPFRNVCIFCQSKTTGPNSMINKETLLCDYSKYLLLRKVDQWEEYCESSGLLKSIDGMSSIFMFVTNSEFKDGLRDAAVGLEVLLRSGRQIASALTQCSSVELIEKAIDSIRPFEASTSKNLAKPLRAQLFNE